MGENVCRVSLRWQKDFFYAGSLGVVLMKEHVGIEEMQWSSTFFFLALKKPWSSPVTICIVLPTKWMKFPWLTCQLWFEKNATPVTCAKICFHVPQNLQDISIVPFLEPVLPTYSQCPHFFSIYIFAGF